MAPDEEDGNRLEDLGLDLVEHRLTERERLLKRAGVFYLWRGNSPDHSSPADSRIFAQNESSQNISNNYNFPAHISVLFHRKQFPVRTLWTYSGLAEDLKQSAPPSRLVLFKKIQESVCTHLRGSERDICSWPLDMERELFAQGVERIHPAVIICFTQGSHDSGLAMLRSVMAGLSFQSELFLLPDVTDMAEGNQTAKNTAWKILQGIF